MHWSCLRALPLTLNPIALSCSETPAPASFFATGHGSGTQFSSPSEISTTTRRPEPVKSCTDSSSVYAIGVSPTARNESTAPYIRFRSSGPIGITSSVS